MNYTTLEVKDEGSTRIITLNRPERRNAISPQMQIELIAAFESSATAPCRVVVLTGAGKSFCAGLDLDAIRTDDGQSSIDPICSARQIAQMFHTIYELPKPVIAAVNGAAIAGGTGLAMVSDYTLATPDAKFGFTEVRIGFIPALVSAYLALQIGDKRARDLLLTGRIVGAQEASRLGLIQEIVEPDRLGARAGELAGVFAANSPQSLAATKQLLAAQNKAWLDTALDLAMKANAQARETEDFREGIAAFLAKRKPSWANEK